MSHDRYFVLPRIVTLRLYAHIQNPTTPITKMYRYTEDGPRCRGVVKGVFEQTVWSYKSYTINQNPFFSYTLVYLYSL